MSAYRVGKGKLSKSEDSGAFNRCRSATKLNGALKSSLEGDLQRSPQFANKNCFFEFLCFLEGILGGRTNKV